MNPMKRQDVASHAGKRRFQLTYCRTASIRRSWLAGRRPPLDLREPVDAWIAGEEMNARQRRDRGAADTPVSIERFNMLAQNATR